MNRKDFFRKLGLGAFTVLVAPKVFEQENKIDTSRYIGGCDPIQPKEFTRITIIDKQTGSVIYNKKNEKTLRIVRNGFYCIGDIFKSYDMEWIVWYMDDEYYYCIPR